MKQSLFYTSMSIFSIFIGSQITEGALLVPYWKSLSAIEFYSYYSQMGPSIGQYYTVLTIVSALIPMALAFYCKSINSKALNSALISSFFAILFILLFFVYFKGANELFYQSALSDVELESELVTWSYWHWSRVFIEFLSLIFLIRSIAMIHKFDIDKPHNRY